MALTISRAVNGWIASCDEETWVFGGDDTEVDDFAEVLRFVNDMIGPPTSRHDAKRVYIRVEPGDKYGGGTE